ncbi:MAG: hypothetical protein ACK559_29335, partial [bacterium]
LDVVSYHHVFLDCSSSLPSSHLRSVATLMGVIFHKNAIRFLGPLPLHDAFDLPQARVDAIRSKATLPTA